MAVRRLQFVALPPPLLVVRIDALNGKRLDGLHAVEIGNASVVGQSGSAMVADILDGFFLQDAADVTVTASRAYSRGHSGQPAARRNGILGSHVQLRPHHPEGVSLVVDQAAGPELRQGQKTRPRHHASLARRALSALTGGNPRHQGQTREIVARQKALVRQIAVDVEVGGGRVLPGRLRGQQIQLADGASVPLIRVRLFLLRTGVVVHDLAGEVPLSFGGGKEVAPSVKGPVEHPRGLLDHALLLPLPVPQGPLQLRPEGRRHSTRDGQSPLPSRLRTAALGQIRFKGARMLSGRVAQIEQTGDGEAQPVFHRGQPNGMKMALKELLIRQVDGWGAHYPLHNLRLIPEVPLVMRALRRAVGEDQRGLPGTPGPSAALGVVGRRRGDVPHIDDVQRRDIHPQLHGRRTVEHRERKKRPALIFLLPILFVPGAAAETPLQKFAGIGGHLRRMLVGLKAEEAGAVARQKSFRGAAVEALEVRVGVFIAPGTHPPLQAGGLQPVTLKLSFVDGDCLHEAVL